MSVQHGASEALDVLMKWVKDPKQWNVVSPAQPSFVEPDLQATPLNTALPQGLGALVPSDSSLSLNKSRSGTTDCQKELALLLPNVAVNMVRHHGCLGKDIIQALVRNAGKYDVATPFWFMNELSSGSKQAITAQVESIETTAHEMCTAMQLYPCHRAHLLGNVEFWEMSNEDAVVCERVYKVFRARGVPFSCSTCLWEGYTNDARTAADPFHFSANDENKNRAAKYISSFVLQTVGPGTGVPSPLFPKGVTLGCRGDKCAITSHLPLSRLATPTSQVNSQASGSQPLPFKPPATPPHKQPPTPSFKPPPTHPPKAQHSAKPPMPSEKGGANFDTSPPESSSLGPLWATFVSLMVRGNGSVVKSVTFRVGGLTDFGSHKFDERDNAGEEGPLVDCISADQGTLIFVLKDFLKDLERERGWWMHVGDGACVANHFLGPESACKHRFWNLVLMACLCIASFLGACTTEHTMVVGACAAGKHRSMTFIVAVHAIFCVLQKALSQTPIGFSLASTAFYLVKDSLPRVLHECHLTRDRQATKRLRMHQQAADEGIGLVAHLIRATCIPAIVIMN